MKVVRVCTEPLSPILMDPMTEEVLDSLITGVSIQPKRDVPPAKIAASKICRENGPNSQIGLPGSMLFSCLKKAGRYVKNGKDKISTAKTTTLPDFLTIQECFLPFTNIPLGEKEKEFWKVDKRRANLWNKGSPTAICAVRPRFDHWEFAVTIEYDETKINEGTLRTLLEKAGSTQGLGAFRPNCGGQFGRFRIKSWTPVLN